MTKYIDPEDIDFGPPAPGVYIPPQPKPVANGRPMLEAVPADTEEQADTWQPTDLVQIAAAPPAPPTIGGLLYPAKRTVLSGETESMKTWLALILAKAELDIGMHVCWVDLDAMGPASLLERLQLLGVDDETISARFHYYEPSEMLDPGKINRTCSHIDQTGTRLFVIDAFNPILSLHGLEPNSTPDIETFWRTIADPICRAGAAPVLIDHVVKNSESRGKYSYGSERKASGAIVHIGFRLLDALNKGGSGRSLLTVHKDRPGYLLRPTLGLLILDATGDTIEYTLQPDKSHDQEGGFRPTILMERVSKYLEEQPDQVSRNQIENGVEGNRDAIRKGIKILVDELYISHTQGANRANLYATIRPYTEAQDTPDTGSPPVRPGFAPSLRSTPTSEFAPFAPYKGEWANRTGDLSEQFAQGSPIHEYERPPIDETQATEGDPFPF